MAISTGCVAVLVENDRFCQCVLIVGVGKRVRGLLKICQYVQNWLHHIAAAIVADEASLGGVVYIRRAIGVLP